jgi:2,3-bisphosphoglycerate-independent phosphoglycerate mutase
VYDAAVEAITATDSAVKTIYDACEEAGYVLLITADHGNAEQMLDPDTGNPHTAHTTNPVPFIITGDKGALELSDEKGSLADVAPTALAIMVSLPECATGYSCRSDRIRLFAGPSSTRGDDWTESVATIDWTE